MIPHVQHLYQQILEERVETTVFADAAGLAAIGLVAWEDGTVSAQSHSSDLCVREKQYWHR